ncbi:MAG: hypothetical protein R6V54_02850 [Desulfobacteraceae bacterium]
MISILPTDTIVKTAEKLFTHLGMATTTDPSFVSRTKKAVTIPGLYVNGDGDNKILIADKPPGSEARNFLRTSNIKLLYRQDHDLRTMNQ